MENYVQVLKTHKNKFCVISTVSSDGQPSSAVVGYAILDNGLILFSTHKGSRKWRNMKMNKRIAFVAGFSFGEPNVQIEGTVILIEAGEKYDETEKIFFTAHPEAAKFKSPSTGFVQLTPHWFRITDYTSQPTKIEERNL